jgi:enediyne biosynthesis protein E4
VVAAVALLGAERSPVQFTDVARDAGIRFTHFKGANGVPTILEEAGPGVCVADFDGDGYEDIYFVNGRDLYNRGITVRNALYRNDGNGTFSDVTDRAAVPGTAYGLGCVWGDYDNDGHPDLYVTQYGRNVLYRNEGEGRFRDVTEAARAGGMDFGTLFHTGATFFDYDRDGFLDLYVGGYARFLPNSQRTCRLGPSVESSCLPQVYGGTMPVLYHNNRDGTFTNVTKAAGMYRPGVNLSVAAADYDNDGWPDLFVANDGIEALLYHNERNGTFTEIGVQSGMALTEDGARMAAMCLSFGDYDNDGNLDLYISDFQFVGDHVWRNDGKGSFEEVSQRAGIKAPTKQVLSFGGGFFDFDNDGWMDLFIANGHVYDGVERIFPGVTYKQINSLFRNTGSRRFEQVTASAGPGFAKPWLGRGAAFLDFDNDGNIDVVVANNGDPPLLLHNSGAAAQHFLNLRLSGTKSNRDGMGARVRVRAGAVEQIREVAGGGSYLSHSALRLHFGLGTSERVDSIEVSWPSGVKQRFTGVATDRFYVIEEGSSEMREANRVPHASVVDDVGREGGSPVGAASRHGI